MITLSVIIPFYNGNEYINKTLEPILQIKKVSKYIAFLEVIIVNDSPNVDVCYDSVFKSLNIKILKNKINRGVQLSRVAGLRNSVGDYVLFLDQDDDIIVNGFIEQLHYVMNNKDADMVVGNCYVEKNGKNYVLYRNSKMYNYIIDINTYICTLNPIVSPGHVLLKRAAIPREWNTLILSNSGSDDLLLWILMIKMGKSIHYNDAFMYIHRDTGNNFSSQEMKMLKSDINVYRLLTSNNILSFKEKKMMRQNIYVKGLSKNIFHLCFLLKVYRFRSVLFYQFLYKATRGYYKVLYIMQQYLKGIMS